MSLFRKGSKAYSIFGFKCPKCMEGDLYLTKSFSFQKSFEMHESCPNCSQDFEPEPGFYYGAMFVSYIFTAFFSIGFLLIFHWVFDFSLMTSFGMLVAFFAIFFVVIFRLARSVWISHNVKYNPPKTA
jgi:uncharacterized protein (DUF983 family)